MIALPKIPNETVHLKIGIVDVAGNYVKKRRKRIKYKIIKSFLINFVRK